ncbi:UPF0481 protein At3g47200-like [Asparagus officinalis]|uniref:UPF0481 protein At3g47200-like n=1 Tax=Asparagus officinalis TaxID=4686 RepID=UPI00098E430B|nr:UPF0481 protein At3g47200-like [Asparagus officinalis]
MNRGLWMDMRRIENQLPLLLLVILIEIGGHEVEDSKSFIRNCDEVPDTELKTIRGKGRHLLDISKRKMTAGGNYIHDRDLAVRTATELFQVGVSFKLADSICYSDISLTNGVLKLSHLYCYSNTENMFLNYTAYEHIHKGTDSAVSNYVLFMDNIIDTDKDVTLLRKAKVVSCTTGSDSEIASLFNRLTQGLPLLDKIHVQSENVNMNIENYCNRRWHKWRAIFIQTYLSNPWVFISLLAAFVLLVLTVIQTTYTIMHFYKSS